jgi:molecular chaperone GrpE
MIDKKAEAEHDEQLENLTDDITNELEDQDVEVVDVQSDDVVETEEGEISLEMQLEKALTERDEFKAALQRERADFINFKKRTEREKSDMRSNIVGQTLTQILGVVDDFDRAMQATPDDVADDGWVTGFTLIHKKFRDLLVQLDVTELNPIGEPFDPTMHEAIGSIESDEYESGTVAEVLQKGYMMNDKCLRVAMVRVAD